jgi:hypothetical protein
VAVLVLFGDALIRPDALVASPESDVVAQFYPWRVYLQRGLEAGTLRVWNPYSFVGEPLLANSQVGAFYPVDRLLFAALPVSVGIAVSEALSVFLAGAGVYLLLARAGVSRTGRTVGALSFALSSAVVTRVYVGHYSIVAAVGFLPFVLLAFERALATGDDWHAVVAGCVLALQLLAGQVQYPYMTVLFAAGYTAVAVEGYGSWQRRARRLVRSYGIAGVVAALLAAVQLLPTLVLSRYTARADGLPFAAGAEGALSPYQLVQFLSPTLLGGPLGPYLDLGNYWEFAFYPGLVALLLAAVAVPTLGRNRRVLAAVATGSGALVLALGPLTPAYWLYYQLPLADSFRVPGRWTLFLALTVCLLAGHGLDRLREAPRRALAGPGLVVVGQAVLLAVVAGLEPTVRGTIVGEVPGLYPRLVEEAGRSLLLGAVTLGLLALIRADLGSVAARTRAVDGRQLIEAALVVLVVGSLLWYQAPLVAAEPLDELYDEPTIETEGRVFDARPTLTVNEYGSPLLEENENVLTGPRSTGGYNPLVLGHTRTVLAGLSADPAAGEPILDALNVTHVVADGDPGEGYTPVGTAGSATVYRNEDPRAEAFFLPEVAADEGVTVATEARLGRATDLRLERRPGGVTAHVRAERAGVVVLSRSWYPLWEAEVDGEPAPVVRTESGVMAVPVDAGDRQVTLAYDPWPVQLGAGLSVLGLLAVVGSWLWRQSRPG